MATSNQSQALALQQSNNNALTQDAQIDIDGLRAVQYAARLMAKSGCFADIKGVDEETAIAKAVVKIAIGRDYGFSAAESMQHIELIQGRPSIAAHARAAKMKAAGYSWKFVKFDAKVCQLEIYGKNGELIGDSSFDMEDAKRMGLATKDNWQKNPRNMLYCRAISNAQRWYAPEVLSAALASKEDVLDGSYDRSEDGFRYGTHTDQDRVAEEKIVQMEADRAARGTAPGETAADRDTRIERQMAEQAEQAKAKEAKILDLPNWPDDPFAAELGIEIKIAGEWYRRTATDVDEWRKVTAPAPAKAEEKTAEQPAKRQAPVFGRSK